MRLIGCNKQGFLLLGLSIFLFIAARSIGQQAQILAQEISPSLSTKKNKENDQERESKFRIENVDQAKFLRGSQTGQGLFRLHGRMRIVLKNGTIEADSVLIDIDRGELLAQGNLLYLEDDGRAGKIKLKRFSYNIKTGSGSLYDASGLRNNFRIEGKTLQRVGKDKSSKLIAKDFSYFPLKGVLPHYAFKMEKIWFYPDGTFLAKNISYEVGGVPIFKLPIFYSGYLGTGIITQVGFTRQRGYFIQNTYQFTRPTDNDWSPQLYRFKLDYYEFTGELFGFAIARDKDPLDYFFSIDIARYKRYRLLGSGNNIDVTNTVDLCQRDTGNITCSLGQDFIPTYKFLFLSNYKYKNLEKDQVRNIRLVIENYNNYLFDYEFGNRLIPADGYSALYSSSLDSDRLPLKTNNHWLFHYSETIKDFSVSLRLERLQIWQNEIIFRESRYDPLIEISPELTLSHRTEIGEVQGFASPIYFTNDFQIQRSLTFENREIFNQLLDFSYDSQFHFLFPFLPTITLESIFGYGFNNSVVDLNQANVNPLSTLDNAIILRDLRLEADRDSYFYGYTEQILTFGSAQTYLQTTYRYKTPTQAREKQTIFFDQKGFVNNQHVNELDWEFATFPRPSIFISLRTIYDLRNFPTAVPANHRWYYPVWDMQFKIDWLNPLYHSRENLLSRNRHQFVETIISNSYVYNTITSKDHSNLFGINFQIGGYNSKLFKRIRHIGLQLYWYHFYANNALDQVRFIFSIDLQIAKRIYWEMNVDSRVFAPENLRNLGDVITDFIDGLGINGFNRQRNTHFNARLLDTNLIFDLEDWELRFGYELAQQNVLTSTNTGSNIAVFYDSKIYMAFNFSRIDLDVGSGRANRFILDRVRPY